MFLLDTDHLVILQRRSEPDCGRLRQRMSCHDRIDFCLSIVSFHEQALGANAYIAQAKNRQGVLRGYELLDQSLLDFDRFRVLPFDERAAVIFDELRGQRVRIGTMDLRIASIALANDMPVLTRNLADFEQVPQLRVEDWTMI
ncbi:MAG: type II toxin-antitoxin system VapC family toxin [Planctomycetales bacterium]|nr:type II toxin-antitoxin system VapC family toxin [Planctomycetales bacterium]